MQGLAIRFLKSCCSKLALEAMQTGAIVGIQDMGAAGLTCSTCEMGARGHVGTEIELDRVPQRETGMTPYEIMLSESQERMLLVAQKGREEEVFRVFEKWGLDAVEIGRVTNDGKMRVLHHGEVVSEIPNEALTDDAPVYKRPLERWEPPVPREMPASIKLAEAGDFTGNLKHLLASPNICGKRWVWQQYDHMVQTNTVEGPGAGDAGVIRIKGSHRALAMALDGNSRWCYLDPQLGAMHAVADAARNVACSGATPVGATNCLNFGNPEKPQIMWQFSKAIDGITKACEELDVPITGGNVSFYNETLGEGIYPTPVIGIVGILEDVHKAVFPHFREPGRAIVLLVWFQHTSPWQRLGAGRLDRCGIRVWLVRVCQGNLRCSMGISSGARTGTRGSAAESVGRDDRRWLGRLRPRLLGGRHCGHAGGIHIWQRSGAASRSGIARIAAGVCFVWRGREPCLDLVRPKQSAGNPTGIG